MIISLTMTEMLALKKDIDVKIENTKLNSIFGKKINRVVWWTQSCFSKR